MFRWASRLSLATEYKMQFHKLTSGSRSLEVLLSMLYVVWRSHHTSWGTFWKSLMNMWMSQHIWVHQVLWLCANGTDAGGQRVLCSWPMGSAPSDIQTTYRSSIAPKTGVFTLVGGVELGHYDLMGCIPTFQSFSTFRAIWSNCFFYSKVSTGASSSRHNLLTLRLHQAIVAYALMPVGGFFLVRQT